MNGKQWIGMMFFGGGIISALYLIVKAMVFAPIVAILVGIMIAIGIGLLMNLDT